MRILVPILCFLLLLAAGILAYFRYSVTPPEQTKFVQPYLHATIPPPPNLERKKLPPQILLFATPSKTLSGFFAAPAIGATNEAVSPVEASQTQIAQMVASLAPSPTPHLGSPTVTPQPTATENAAIAALRELQNQPGGQGSLLGGIKDSKPSSPTQSRPPPTATINLTPTATPPLPRVGGMPTGYTMLYFMHPRSRLTVERQLEAMERANLNEVYLGAMVDGTFGLDFGYLDAVIRRLNTDDRIVTLVLYFSNGSAMRDYDKTNSPVAFNLAPPDIFRLLIQFDPGTREKFQQMVSRAIPAYELNAALNPRNTNLAIVMLEDNLDQDSYRSMRELAASVLHGRAEIIRNACPGCATGNDPNPLGDAIESHDPRAIPSLTIRDGYSMDGTGYELPGDPPGQQLSINSVHELKSLAISEQIRYFGLWRKQRQGLGSTLIDPSDRTYEVPTDQQFQIEVDLLRWGLEQATPTPEPSESEE
jgi:hypothetical protein